MAVPVLPLNLAPRPSFWRLRHLALGWISLGAGSLILAGALGFTWRAYHQAGRAGREAVSLTEEARRAGKREQQLQASLQDMDAAREQSRWKLAERILQERSLPWSRLTTELEQCMVPDMRLKSLQRARSNAQQVVMKLKGEARTRQAEAAFVEALHAAPVFAQVVLERESERTGGGWDFELSLPAAAVPPPFEAKPIKQASASPSPAPSVAPARPAAPPGRSPGLPARPSGAPVMPSSSTPQPPAPVLGPPVSPAPPDPAKSEAPAPLRRRLGRMRPTDSRPPDE
jgi:hypothetical protein